MFQVKARITLLAVICALPSVAAAQSQPYDLLNPGARSLALGSAFAGLADDATAALTNPAGLMILRAPEVSFELRAKHDDNADPGFENSVDPSYLSFVYPRQRWALAGYRREFARIRSRFEDPPDFSYAETLTSAAYGVSGAVSAGSRVKVGGGLVAYQVDYAANFTDRFSGRLQTFSAAADKTKVGFNIGGLITPVAEPRGALDLFQIGAVYRKAPTFPVRFSGTDVPPEDIDDGLTLPEAVTVGTALRFKGAATVVLDYTHIEYGEDAVFASGENLDEFHVGFEYVLSGIKWPPAVRVGTWREKDFGSEDEYIQHFTFGGGISPHKRLDINAGFDLAESTRVFSVSAVVRMMK